MLDSGMADDSKKSERRRKRRARRFLKRGRKVGGAILSGSVATLSHNEVAQSLVESSRTNEQVFIRSLGGGCGAS
jgi:hypothetical protein